MLERERPRPLAGPILLVCLVLIRLSAIVMPLVPDSVALVLARIASSGFGPILFLLLVVERNRLPQFYVRRSAALLTVVLAVLYLAQGFVASPSRIPLSAIPNLMIMVLIGAIIAVGTRKHASIQWRFGSNWLVIATGLAMGLLMWLLLRVPNVRPQTLTVSLIVRSLVSQLHVALYEELTFRGFLSGYLRSFGMSESRANYAQAILFWLGHADISALGSLSFWIGIPIGSVMFGIVANRYKSTTASVIVHTMTNCLSSWLRMTGI